MPTSHFLSAHFSANGVKFHYRRRGGVGAPLVALHGLFGSGACLLPLIDALDSKLDVILPDARGHGSSGSPPCGYRYPDLARDVIALITCLGFDSPILLGHSMGGMTACLVASEIGQGIRALVLVDPTFLSAEYQQEVFESGIGEDHSRQLRTPRADLIAHAQRRSPHRPEQLIESLVDARLSTCAKAVEVLTPPNPDFRDLMRRVGVPTLLVTGSSGVVSQDMAQELRRLNPQLRHHHIDGAGHGMPYDAPRRVAAAVTQFLLMSS